MQQHYLDEYEIECVRFFAERYLSRNEVVEHHEFPRAEEVGIRKILDARTRLYESGLIDGEHSTAIKVLPACVALVEEWDNPPLRDRWDEATKWFRSKWWSLPALLVAVGLPALKGWGEVINMVLGWMGIISNTK